jgi:hypothetical protein
MTLAKHASRLVAVLALVGALLFNAGCASTPQRPPSPQVWQMVAYTAAKDGATLYLLEHPETNNVAAFATAKSALDLLIANGEFSTVALHAALKGLPVRKLNGTAGVILVDTATVLFVTLTGGQSVIEQRPVVEAFAIGIRDGLAARAGGSVIRSPCPVATTIL